MKESSLFDNLLNKQSLFWTPNYLDISSWIEHLPFAFWVIESLKPKVVVELGVYNGTSYFAFCQAIKILNINTTCYGVDTWKGDEHAGFYNDNIFEKVNNYNTQHYSRFSTLVRSTFNEAKDYFLDESIDLLHIDGLHTYEAIKEDFETWYPKLSPNAIVVFHDINVRERNFGVFRFWEELKVRFKHFQFDFGHGLGIIALGEIADVELNILFNTPEVGDNYIFLRNLFSERGSSFKNKLFYSSISDSDNLQIKNLQVKIMQLSELNKNQQDEINRLNETIHLIEKNQLNEKKESDNIWQLQINEKNLIIGESLQKIHQKELLIDEQNHKIYQLYQDGNKSKERLSEIYESDGWKLLKKYYNLKGKLLPKNSNRYNRLKLIFNKFRLKKKLNNDSPEIIERNLSFNNYQIDAEATTFNIIDLPIFQFPEVSIIIPAYNAWPINYQCIKSILTNSHGVAYEVILADDMSSDETKNCTDKIINLVHIRNEVNLGFLKNCNYAAQFAKGKSILFLNNDTIVNAGWLAPLVNLINSDASIGMVGSKLIYPDGALQEAGGIIWNDASGWNYGHKQNPSMPEYNYVKEVDYISGASILIKKELWVKAGGFDERYSPAYFEDTDLAFTIRSMGFKVLYQPLSEVVHFEGYSHGVETKNKEDNKNIKSFQIINKQKFYDKWQNVLLKDHLQNGKNVFNARDRSIPKKTIVIIDHYVPHYDKDAGSKTTLQYLELFVLLGLNVKFIGDNFVKHQPYTNTLEQMGVEVLYGNYYKENWQKWIIDNREHIDYVYLNRPHISIKYIDFIKENTKAKIFYYGHDIHFIREEMHYKLNKDRKLLESATEWKKTEMELFKKSDIILTPGDKEMSIISGLDNSFKVESILPFFFKEPAVAINDFLLRENIIFVGGFGHTPNIDAVQWFCKAVWPLVIEKLPPLKFIVVGSNPPDAIKNLQCNNIKITGFVSEKELVTIYNNARIGLIPLRYGAGVKGKTVEAMHKGLPLVSTSFGLEGMPGNIDKIIIPQNDAAQFANEIIRLYENIPVLTNLSLQEVNYINEFFTIDAATAKMREILNI